MILKPSDLSIKDRYKLAIGTILPRPIAWVSTMDTMGNLNLAPFSYFTVGCTDPLTLIFCPQIPADSGRKKDTWLNIEAIPEFVINIANEDTARAMNTTSAALPRGTSEFEHAYLTPVPSVAVRVPRVAEAPVAFECTLQRIVTIRDQPGGGAAVFGTVQCIHIRDDLYEGRYVKLDALKPIGRLAGNRYVRVTDIFEMPRP